jgi:hypothetical protein
MVTKVQIMFIGSNFKFCIVAVVVIVTLHCRLWIFVLKFRIKFHTSVSRTLFNTVKSKPKICSHFGQLVVLHSGDKRNLTQVACFYEVFLLDIVFRAVKQLTLLA